MPGAEPVVTEDHMHLALAALRQGGAEHLLSHIHAHEPHLVEHVRFFCELIRDDLTRMSLSDEQVRRIAADFASLAAVVTFALRLGYGVRYPTGNAELPPEAGRPDPTLN